MKEIILWNSDKVALVDDDNYEQLIQFNWRRYGVDKRYAAALIKTFPKKKIILMHRFILNAIKDKRIIDHIDRNPLNNQKNNLRFATHGQNLANTVKRKGYSSEYKGVHFDKYSGKWRVSVGLGGKLIDGGRFENELQAAKKANKIYLKYYGGITALNQV